MEMAMRVEGAMTSIKLQEDIKQLKYGHGIIVMLIVWPFGVNSNPVATIVVRMNDRFEGFFAITIQPSY